MEKIKKRETAILRLHTNLSFEGTIESLRDVLCFKHTPKNNWPQSCSYCYPSFFFLETRCRKK